MKKYVEWAGTIASILGAFLMAFGFVKIALIGYTLGSLLWLSVAMYDRNFSLLALNFCFFVANSIGIVRNFVL